MLDARLCSRWFSCCGGFEVDRTAAHLAAERQAHSPLWRFDQEREQILLGDRADRRFNDQLVVAVKHHLHAARLSTDDSGGEQVAGDALNNILGERASPSTRGFPLPARVVEEFDIWWAFLEPVILGEAGVWIVDDAIARQGDGEIGAVEV